MSLTIADDSGRRSSVVEAVSTFAAVEQLCADMQLAADMRGRPWANLVIMASPHDHLPGMTTAGQRTLGLLQAGKTQAEVATKMQQ